MPLPRAPGQEAEIERAHARRRRVQHVEAVPLEAERAHRRGKPPRRRQHRRPVGPRQRALPHDQHRPLRLPQRAREAIAAIVQGVQQRGRVAQEIRRIGEVGGRPDRADRDIAVQQALADARVQHRRLVAGIAADQQQCVRLLDGGDRRR